MNLGQIIEVPKKIGDFSISIWIKLVYELSFKLITYDSLFYLLRIHYFVCFLFMGIKHLLKHKKSSEHVLVVKSITYLSWRKARIELIDTF